MGWKDAPEVKASPAWASAPEVSASDGFEFPRWLGSQVRNAAAGAVRGAGSIGATVLSPRDALESYIARKMGAPELQVGDRRQAMTGALSEMGADPSSVAFGAGKLGAEVAGTAGVGGALAKPVAAVLGRAAPSIAPAVTEAVRTAGMSTGGVGGAAGMAARMAGGAITGGASAGLVDPQEAAMGAAIGGAAPVVIKAAGAAVGGLARMINGPQQAPEVVQAVRDARAAGYVIPPTQAKPTLANRVLEGFSGKLTTAQNASARNQAVTNELAAKSVGLGPGTKLSIDELALIRERAGQAYQDIANTGMITPSKAYEAALAKIEQPFKLTAGAFPNSKPSPVLDLVESVRSPAFAASSAVEKIKQLRTAADDAYRTGNTDVGRAAKAAAKALEDAVEEHLKVIGQPDMLKKFQDARKLIAKTYDVQAALNSTTGTVDARKLGIKANRGKPMTDELRQIADFANRFPKAAQTVEGMGSLPQTSPLDWGLAAMMGASTMNPLALLTAGARPATRAAILSGPVQNRLADQTPNAIAQLLAQPRAQQLMYRAAPVIGASE